MAERFDSTNIEDRRSLSVSRPSNHFAFEQTGLVTEQRDNFPRNKIKSRRLRRLQSARRLSRGFPLSARASRLDNFVHMYAFTLKVPLGERAAKTSVPGTTGELRAAKRFDARQFRALIGVLESRRPGSLRRRASSPLPRPRCRIARYAKRTTLRGGDYRSLQKRAAPRDTRAPPRSCFIPFRVSRPSNPVRRYHAAGH